MRKVRLVGALVVFLFVFAGCAGTHFGVPDRASYVPAYFDATNAAIMKAEKSPGAKHCPDKIKKAKALAKEGAQAYWACRSQEASKKMADARALAAEAEKCQPPPPPKPKPVTKPVPHAQPTTIVLEGVNFATDSAKLTPESKAILDWQASVLKRRPELKIEIAGHTDSRGTAAYNQRLSERRAKAVRDYLISQGISADRLKAVGYGESQPIASNDTAEGMAKNRRIELRIIK